MSDLTLVQADTAPDIEGTLTFADGSPVNLASATVKFQMRKADDRRFTVNAAADIVTAASGLVSYSWAANDLAVPGDYQVQWEVTFPDGKVQTQGEPNTITIRRQ